MSQSVKNTNAAIVGYNKSKFNYNLMKNKKNINLLMGLWLIIISISLVIGFLLSKFDRLQWLPFGEMYNFYYTIILGFCILLYVSIDLIYNSGFARIIASIIVWTILIAIVIGIAFPKCAVSWTGDFSIRPPCEFNTQIASIIGLIGGGITGIILGARLVFNGNKTK